VSRADQSSSSDLDPLFESAKVLDPVSDVARARIRARARATVAAASRSTLPAATSQQTSRSRLALAAGVAFVLGATGTAAAFLGHGAAVPRSAPTAPKTSVARTPPIVNTVADDDRPTPSIDEEPVVKAATPRHHRRASRVSDPRAAELALIQHAQAAYADGNLPNALELLAEHGRRFPTGRLAEEREALRVRSLAGCGRSVDARRALAAFADRYPHSVLLPHLRQTLGSDTAP
jgi:hypothetical protein